MENKEEKPKESVDDIIKRMKVNDYMLDRALASSSYEGALRFYIPYLRHLSDHIGNVLIKKIFRDFLNRMEDIMEENGSPLDYKIKDYKYRR